MSGASDRTHEVSAEAVDVGFCLPSVCPGNVARSAFGRSRIAQGFPPAGEAEGTQRRARCTATGREGPGDALSPAQAGETSPVPRALDRSTCRFCTTRLETRTKESNMCASTRVENLRA